MQRQAGGRGRGGRRGREGRGMSKYNNKSTTKHTSSISPSTNGKRQNLESIKFDKRPENDSILAEFSFGGGVANHCFSSTCVRIMERCHKWWQGYTQTGNYYARTCQGSLDCQVKVLVIHRTYVRIPHGMERSATAPEGECFCWSALPLAASKPCGQPCYTYVRT